MYVHSHEPADYGGIIQKENKVRIKLLKTPRESNAILYDAKYPAESFLTKDAGLDGGFVPEQTHSNPETASASPKTKKSKNTEKIPHRTFDDVAGMDKTIEILKRKVLFPMLYPEAFPDNKNKGTILYGPPGTGKTLLALAIIGEAKKRKNKDIFCIQVDGGAMTRGVVGESEAEWRKIFAKLKNNQPSLLFIDEIDSILGIREKGENFEHSNKVVSQILTLTENLEKNNDKVWIIGATNRPERIDPAIKRNGRFGNLIEVPVPDEKGCLEILNHYLKDKPSTAALTGMILQENCSKNQQQAPILQRLLLKQEKIFTNATGFMKKWKKEHFNWRTSTVWNTHRKILRFKPLKTRLLLQNHRICRYMSLLRGNLHPNHDRFCRFAHLFRHPPE